MAGGICDSTQYALSRNERRLSAELPQEFVGVEARVVAVGPEDFDRVGADEAHFFDVNVRGNVVGIEQAFVRDFVNAAGALAFATERVVIVQIDAAVAPADFELVLLGLAFDRKRCVGGHGI